MRERGQFANSGLRCSLDQGLKRSQENDDRPLILRRKHGFLRVTMQNSISSGDEGSDFFLPNKTSFISKRYDLRELLFRIFPFPLAVMPFQDHFERSSAHREGSRRRAKYVGSYCIVEQMRKGTFVAAAITIGNVHRHEDNRHLSPAAKY